MSNIRLFIVDDSEETRGLVRRYIEIGEEFQVVGEAGSGKEALEKLRVTDTDIVLMDINMPNGNGLETTEEISKKYPHIVVVIMSVQREAEYLKKAMLSGAREYIIKPFNMDSLTLTINSAYNTEMERRRLLGATKEKEDKKGTITTFYSSKGGVGKSLIASNYAVMTAKLKKEKTILVDMDLLFGDIGLLLDAKSRQNIFTLIEEGEKIDEELIKKHISSYKENLDLLLSPSSPELAEVVKGSHVEELLMVLRSLYDHVVIDTTNDFSETTIMALDLSNKIYYISTPDLLSIKNTKVGLEVMNSLSYKEGKISVMINQDGMYGGLDKAEIKKILSYEIGVFVPQDIKTVGESISSGEPIGYEKKLVKSKIYKALENMVK